MNNAPVFLSLGSNLGHRINYLTAAVIELKKRGKIHLENVSSVYETEPVGLKEQNLFLNCIVQITTAYTPQQLLQINQQIEKKLGRQRREKWGPRTLDIDIIFFNTLVINSTDLTIPHPEYTKRLFVLKPLSEIAADFAPPLQQENIQKQVQKCNDKSSVKSIMNKKSFLNLVK